MIFFFRRANKYLSVRNVFYVFVIREGNIFLTRKLFLQVFGQALIAYIIFAVLIIDPSHFVFVLKRFYNLLIPINNLEQFARSITYNAVDARDCQLEEERREATPIFPLIIRNPGIEVTWRVTTADRTFKFVSFFFFFHDFCKHAVDSHTGVTLTLTGETSRGGDEITSPTKLDN